MTALFRLISCGFEFEPKLTSVSQKIGGLLRIGVVAEFGKISAHRLQSVAEPKQAFSECGRSTRLGPSLKRMICLVYGSARIFKKLRGQRIAALCPFSPTEVCEGSVLAGRPVKKRQTFEFGVVLRFVNIGKAGGLVIGRQRKTVLPTSVSRENCKPALTGKVHEVSVRGRRPPFSTSSARRRGPDADQNPNYEQKTYDFHRIPPPRPPSKQQAACESR